MGNSKPLSYLENTEFKFHIPHATKSASAMTDSSQNSSAQLNCREVKVLLHFSGG